MMLDIKERRTAATPLARRVARAHGVDLAGVKGSGPGGRVVKADVLARLRRAPVSAEPAPTRMGGRPARENRPLATAMLEADVGAALARLAAQRAALARAGLGAGLVAEVLAAVAALLPAHPLLNARWGDEAIVLRRRVHIAAAASGAGGVAWALVRDAGDRNLRGLARALAEPADDLAEATFAVVVLDAGAGWLAALPPLPGTAAALSVGAPVARATAVGGELAARPLAALTLSYDARLIDHAEAARFLVALRARLAG